MAKYNINQFQKMIDRLYEVGIKTEKALVDMKMEDLEKLPNYTLTDVKTIITLKKIAKDNKQALVLFFREEEK